MAFRDTLLGTVSLSGLWTDLMVLFFFCDLFLRVGYVERPETCGDIGLVILSGVESRRAHPVCVDGATMARRAPFPPSSIPAYIKQSIMMKLFVCLQNHSPAPAARMISYVLCYRGIQYRSDSYVRYRMFFYVNCKTVLTMYVRRMTSYVMINRILQKILLADRNLSRMGQ
jgi:hypothetical protein